MSYYAGFSLREVYKKRCADLQCAANSAVVKLLSDIPDDFTSLTALDLSRNFVGTKGVIPLLDVVECATAIRSLDLRSQELGNEAVAIVCARLRRHPSLQRLNMSDNPITLAVATDLLELAKNNPVLQYICLERTLVRPSMVTAIEVQLEKNRQRAAGQVSPTRSPATFSPTSAAAAAPATSSHLPPAASADTAAKAALPAPSTSGLASATNTMEASTPAGGGALAAASLLQMASSARAPHSKATVAAAARKRCPPHEVQHVLRPFSHTVTDVLFDVDPTADLWDWCEDRHYFFDDDQFSSRNDDLHRTSRHTYGIAGWRRVGELYPHATLFGSGALSNFCAASDDRSTAGDAHATAVSAAAASGLLPEADSLFVQLPTDVPEGFTWTFTSMVASMKDVRSLQAMLCCPRPNAAAVTPAALSSSPSRHPPPLAQQHGTDFPGIYAMRLYVEGVWRTLIVDDFLPVDKFGRLIFTKPALNDTAFWPCIVEKMLAKLYGGYYALDSHFDEHCAGIDGPSIRRPIAWKYLSRENLRRVTGGSAAAVQSSAPSNDDATPSSLFLERITGGCGRVMSYFTSGFYESHRLHPLEENAKEKWWDDLLKTLAAPPRQPCANVASRSTSVTLPLSGGGGGGAVGAAPSDPAARVDDDGRPCQTPAFKRRTLAVAGRTPTAANSTNAAGSLALHTGVVAISRDAAHTSNGIHARTGYQVLRACHVNGVRLLMLRNPWCGAQKWSGDWADDSPLWKKNPEIAGMLLQRASTFADRGESIRSLAEATAYTHGDSSALTMQSNLKRSLLTAMRSSGGSGDGTGAAATAAGASNILSSTSPSITSAPGSGGGSGDAGSGVHVAKSTFWMSHTDFLQNFDWVHFCRVFGDEFSRRDIHHEWTRETAGGHVQELSWHTNPHYRLMLPHRTTVRLQLNRRDVGLRRSRAIATASVDALQRGEGGIGLQVIRDAYYPLHCPSPNSQDVDSPFKVRGNGLETGSGGDGGGGLGPAAVAGGAVQGGTSLSPALLPPMASFSTLLFSAAEQVGDHLTAELTLDAGTQYWIVPTTCAPRMLDHFDLSVVASASFQMQEAVEAQYWDSRTTPQEVVVASSVPQVGQSDGELAILFNDRAWVKMDAVAMLMQAESKRRATQLRLGGSNAATAAADVTAAATSAAAAGPTPQPPCRVVVTAAMEVGDNDDETGEFGVDEAYEQQQMRQDDPFPPLPTVALALVSGEVDSEGSPSRTIGDIDPHPSCVYAIGQHAVLEAEVAPSAEHDVAYYTAICSPRPAGTRALISWQVWCAAPLLEVRSLPQWAKEEITVAWDDPRGSGNFYECDGHPQIELTELQPYQRFTVALRMLDYDTIVPAIMFSVIRTAQQTGEPVSGRLAENELYARSEYVDVPEVQASFELGGDVPASLLLIPCLQPTGSRGRCVVMIASDNAHFRARALCGGTWQ
ncbi:calpain-like cysteine peptidase [Lotmaria passim]